MKKFILGFITAIVAMAIIYLIATLSFTGPLGDPPKGVVKSPSPDPMQAGDNKQTGILEVTSDPSGQLKEGELILFFNSTGRTLTGGDKVEFDRKTERLGDIFDGMRINYAKVRKKL